VNIGPSFSDGTMLRLSRLAAIREIAYPQSPVPWTSNERRDGWMSTKKRQTMQKVARERDLREKRALKQEKRDARRAAAASGEAPVEPTPQDETLD